MAQTNASSTTHVIFDLDGTLLDTEELYTTATQHVVGQHGKVFSLELKRLCMGGDAHRGAELVIKALALPLTPREYLKQRDREILRLVDQARPMQGAESLMRRLFERGIPMALATSGDRAITEEKLARHEFLRMVSCIVCGDDARLEQPKPAPDIYLLAAAELAAEPECCAAIEDSALGVESASLAGMRTIALVDSRYGFEPALFAAAHLQIASLTELSLRDLGIDP